MDIGDLLNDVLNDFGNFRKSNDERLTLFCNNIICPNFKIDIDSYLLNITNYNHELIENKNSRVIKVDYFIDWKSILPYATHYLESRVILRNFFNKDNFLIYSQEIYFSDLQTIQSIIGLFEFSSWTIKTEYNPQKLFKSFSAISKDKLIELEITKEFDAAGEEYDYLVSFIYN